MPRARDEHGFSLVEVLFALAVIGLALGATAGMFGNFRLGHASASDLDHALAIAENELAEAGTSGAAGRDGRFAWQVAVSPFADPDADALKGLRLYRLEARVTWRQNLSERRVALATLRLLPSPPP